MKNNWLITLVSAAVLFVFIFIACRKNEWESGKDINNSLTLFKMDNVNNNQDLLATDTVSSGSGLEGKYIGVYGNAGAALGLGKIILQLFNAASDSLLTTKEITTFFRPEYHVFNTQLNIPKSERGKIYKIVASSFDVSGKEIAQKYFYGMDVLTCDPLPPCIVNNQTTIMLETPANTPVDENLYIFGSINGWGKRDDPTLMFYKNPDMANCYCLSIPYAPGSTDWQLGQIFVTRGTWATQAVTLEGIDTNWDYSTTERGAIWQIKVAKWRDL